MEESNKGLWIAVALVIILVIVSILFGIVKMSKDNANKSQDAVQQNLNNLAELNFSDYDQQTVSGTQVKASISLFSGQPVAVVVITEDSLTGNNYNALLEGVSDPANPSVTMNEIETGKSAYVAELATSDTGTLAYNTITGPTSQAGNKAYIRASARFKCDLIKNASGATIGYVAKQIIDK